MSCKIPLSNSFKSNCDQQWLKSTSVDSNVKFAGEEAKDRLYEPKHKKKLVRVLTVVAYVFFVSLAAIMLSLYYVFLWNGNQKENVKIRTIASPSVCDHGREMLQMRLPEPTITFESVSSIPMSSENMTQSVDFNDDSASEFEDFRKRSIFFKKFLKK